MLVGSRARGEAHRGSDVDLLVVRSGPLRTSIALIQGGLFSSCVGSHRAFLAELTDPFRSLGAVPAWRSARVLYDPHGLAARLQAVARRWRWAPLRRSARRRAGREVAELAEEVGRLVGHLEAGDRWVAAVQRDVLATHLPPLIALHDGLLFPGTENRLWPAVAAHLGPAWRRAHQRALAMHGESLTVSCRAALYLYAEAARVVYPSLGSGERAVVDWALALARLRGRSESPEPPRRR